jgi:hypothetical protein
MPLSHGLNPEDFYSMYTRRDAVAMKYIKKTSKVGRCSLTLSELVLKALMVSALKAII